MRANKRIWKRIAAGLCPLFLLFCCWTAYLYITAPVWQLRGVKDYTPPFKTYTRQAGLGLPNNLTVNDMPLEMVLAVMVSEDETFVQHYGLNPSYTLSLLKESLVTGRHLSSGSTLTQQLVKNVFVGPRRTLYRKYSEMVYAIKMEHYYTKSEIFELYVNIAQTGDDMYGYEKAAESYFGKRAAELTPAESVFIVDLMPGPKARSAWFLEHSPTPVNGPPPNKGRMISKLVSALKLKAGLEAQGPLPDNETLFSQPALLEQASAVTWSREQSAAIEKTAAHMVQKFIKEHTYDSNSRP